MSASDTDPRKSPENGKSENGKPENGRAAHAVIALFGGVRPMAHALGVAASTVEGWKERSSIPRTRHADIAAAAQAGGLTLDPALLAASDRMQAPTLEASASEVATGEPPSAVEPGEAQPEPDEPEPREPERRPPGWLARLAPQLPAAALGALLVIAGFLLAVGTSDVWLGAPQGGGAGGDLSALEGRVAALEQAPADKDAGGRDPAIGTLSAAVSSLEQDLAALRKQVQALPVGSDGAATDALGARLDELAKGLADLRAEITLLPKQDAALGETVAAAQQQLATLDQRLLALEANVGTLSGRLGTVEETQAEAARSGPAALAVAAAGLQDAVLNGRAYAAELEVVRGLAGGEPAFAEPLQALSASADGGVATLADLTARFAETAPAIVRAAQAPAADGDLLDEAWESISGLVTVRPVGDVPGDGVGARVARAEARLGAGDLAAAVAELEGLSGAPAEAAADWLRAARERLAAEAAARSITGLALGGMDGGGKDSGGKAASGG